MNAKLFGHFMSFMMEKSTLSDTETGSPQLVSPSSDSGRGRSNEELRTATSKIRSDLLDRAVRDAEEKYHGPNLGPHFRPDHVDNLIWQLVSAFNCRSVYGVSLTATRILVKLFNVMEPLGFTKSRRLCKRLSGLVEDVKTVRDWRRSGEITTEMQHILVGDLLEEDNLGRFFSELFAELQNCAESIPRSEQKTLALAIIDAFCVVLGLDEVLGDEKADDALILQRTRTWPP